MTHEMKLIDIRNMFIHVYDSVLREVVKLIHPRQDEIYGNVLKQTNISYGIMTPDIIRIKFNISKLKIC